MWVKQSSYQISPTNSGLWILSLLTWKKYVVYHVFKPMKMPMCWLWRLPLIFWCNGIWRRYRPDGSASPLQRPNSSDKPPAFLHTKVVNWNLKQLIEQLQVQDRRNFLKYILVLHFLLGCDTTSRIFGKGKEKLIKITVQNSELDTVFDVFYNPTAIKSTILQARDEIVLVLFGSNKEDNTLNSLRVSLYECRCMSVVVWG